MEAEMAQALARALADAKIAAVTEVPGYGATDVYAAYCALTGNPPIHSYNEEVSYTIAHGTAMAGARAAALFKSHGLARAATSILNSLPAGTQAGLLALVFHDPTAGHSENIWDAGRLLDGIGIPYRPVEPGGGYVGVMEALTHSESLRLPVALLINSDDLRASESFTPSPASRAAAPYRRDVTMHALNPLLAGYRDEVLRAKLSGRDWRAIRPPALPVIPDSLSEAWAGPVRLYTPLFRALGRQRARVVAGDIGVSNLFALPPFEVIDMDTHFGGSIALAIGAHLAGYPGTWAVTGDYALLAGGHMALLEALQRNIPAKVLILYNGTAVTTGGQPVPAPIFDALLAGYAQFLVTIRNPLDEDECEAVLRSASQASDVRIVVADYRGRF